MNEAEFDELRRLRVENARLRALLLHHGIAIDELIPSMPKSPILLLSRRWDCFVVCSWSTGLCKADGRRDLPTQRGYARKITGGSA